MFTLDDVKVSFGNRQALTVEKMRFDSGAAVALMGSNGSGKTTLLRVLAGLLTPTSGSVRKDYEITVGYVSQHHHPHAFMPMTVSEVLMIGRFRERGLLGRMRKADRDAMDAAADRLKVADLRRRSFGHLSGGQRQRVLIASALASQADCLLLDEPITGLDIPSQDIVLDVVDAERMRNKLVVLSTHHLSEARLCERIVLLKGAVLADGTPAEVLNEENMAAAFGANALTRLEVGEGDKTSSLLVLEEPGHTHDAEFGRSSHIAGESVWTFGPRARP
ncbi:metal ABC transporter ATP-binding protein [Candidatus Poriferisodalis sp.]|uniref:metal ABC transporter ATP-binding protein n=1 Tax=Candidatus Poriferisodalis sp. TaxID=3101277 RepID=UPI003B51E19D